MDISDKEELQMGIFPKPDIDMAGCQFLTVEAYSRGTNSAVGFYDKCDFVAAEEPNPNKETLRMYKTILPVVKYDDEEE